MLKFLKEVFSKENLLKVDVLNYLVTSRSSKDAIILYKETFYKNEMLDMKKAS